MKLNELISRLSRIADKADLTCEVNIMIEDENKLIGHMNYPLTDLAYSKGSNEVILIYESEQK